MNEQASKDVYQKSLLHIESFLYAMLLKKSKTVQTRFFQGWERPTFKILGPSVILGFESVNMGKEISQIFFFKTLENGMPTTLHTWHTAYHSELNI